MDLTICPVFPPFNWKEYRWTMCITGFPLALCTLTVFQPLIFTSVVFCASIIFLHCSEWHLTTDPLLTLQMLSLLPLLRGICPFCVRIVWEKKNQPNVVAWPFYNYRSLARFFRSLALESFRQQSKFCIQHHIIRSLNDKFLS